MKRIYLYTVEYAYARFPKTIGLVARHMLYVRYLIAGAISAATDIASLYVFTDILGIWYITSAIIAFLIAFVVSFLLQKFWTFRDNGTDGMHKQAMSYLAVQIASLSINTAGLYILVDMFGVWYIFGQFIMGLLIAVFNFAMYRTFIFTEERA